MPASSPCPWAILGSYEIFVLLRCSVWYTTTNLFQFRLPHILLHSPSRAESRWELWVLVFTSVSAASLNSNHCPQFAVNMTDTSKLGKWHHCNWEQNIEARVVNIQIRKTKWTVGAESGDAFIVSARSNHDTRRRIRIACNPAKDAIKFTSPFIPKKCMDWCTRLLFFFRSAARCDA